MRVSFRVWAVTLLVLAATPAGAFEIDVPPVQGGLVHGTVAPGSRVWFAGRELRVTPDGGFVIGFGRNSGPDAEIRIEGPDGRVRTETLPVAARTWPVQRIDGLPPGKVTPRSAEDLARIQREAALIQRAKARDTAADGFAEAAIWPARGPVSGVFGSQRILNGNPRSPHRGVDVAAPEGAPVTAMASGTVSLAEADLFFTGGTVIIDHGHGVHSIYAHLSQVDVAEGQEVAQGARIGAVGATGRATGPHLHWGVYWFDRAVDPALLVGPMPAS